jgi:agmatine/peptidylarginine deiminase
LIKLPAEWEKQKFVQLTMPHKMSDWNEYLPQSLECVKKIAKAIAKYQRVILICDDLKDIDSELKNLQNIEFFEAETNDTWCRDYGGITIFENNRAKILNFGFNGWGLKFASNYDNQLTLKMKSKGLFGDVELETKDIILEGGSIDSNGAGTILTTSKCLLEANRNPHLSQKELESKLKEYFGIERIISLNYGYLAGDDTDSHIDTLARFVNENTIVYTKCYDREDEHFFELNEMEKELKKSGFHLIPVPLPEPKYFEDDRLPATYVNFLIINGAVLVPLYNDKSDELVLDIFRNIFKDRDVIGIDCEILIRQHGSLHCMSMQYHI